MIRGIDDDWDRHIAQMLVDQRADAFPFETTDPGGQSRQSDAGDLVLDQLLLERLQAMLDVVQTRPSGFVSVLKSALLSNQVEDPDAESAPLPQVTWLRVLLMSKVPVVLVHGRPAFSESAGQTLIKRIVRRDPMRDRLSLGKQNVAGHFMNHVISSTSGTMV